jgi:hypothetical protein
MQVAIAGDGVAARCCAHLLTQAGYGVLLEAVGRSRVPAIMIGEAAQRLVSDIFGQPYLFQGLARIEQRIVAWGPEAAAVTLPHSAVIVSEEVLLDRLGMAPQECAPADWTIRSAPPLPESTVHRFGSRTATLMPVELKSSAAPHACWVESLEEGWLFLSPEWLIAVGEHPEDLLQNSKVVAGQIARWEPGNARISAWPRMALPLGGDGWIACGSAAMAFDPLCGDGTAHAVREAILACAVIRAVDAGGDRRALFAHYEARLAAGFERHLLQCRPFYSSGGLGPWWQAEANATEQGIEWCRGRAEAHGAFRYRLNGLELHVL